ncbi:synaptosomal-associated protein 29 isoform X1 [Oncorhynchus masou masou]|uniref:synaptosomal-associated protein 29 isoform X1 n=2 Tax=Oncorhynchus masou masou TaxID=90313 RepID=UPI00318383E0
MGLEIHPQMAYPRTHNPFADDDEEEQRWSSGGFDDPQERGMSEAERKQRCLQQEVMRTAKSAVVSSHRSLGLIYESEKIGAETAEELMRQGEALKRTERMVDNMGQDLKTSQKHINSIKSVWGGLVTYFKAKPETTKSLPEEPVVYQASSKLQNAMSHSKEHEGKYQASHPNLRKLDSGGFDAFASDDSSSGQNGYPANRQLRAAHQTLDNNLDEMSLGLGRLKDLGLGLQSEIENQDTSLDNLLGKVDKLDLKINNTNQQIKNLK